MKLEKNKVFVKNGKATKPIDAREIIIGDRVLGDLIGELDQVKMAYEKLTNQLKDCYVVQKDKEILIEIDGQLQRSKLKLYEDKELDYPLDYYIVENGEIKLNERKVAAL